MVVDIRTCEVMRKAGRVAIGTAELGVGVIVSVTVTADVQVSTRTKYGSIPVREGEETRVPAQTESISYSRHFTQVLRKGLPGQEKYIMHFDLASSNEAASNECQQTL